MGLCVAIAALLCVGVGYVSAESGPAELAKQYAVSQAIDSGSAIFGVYGDICRNTIRVGEPWVEPGFAAWDEQDGWLTEQVTVSGTVDTSQVGIYTLLYNVIDSAGNPAVQVVREVVVIDTDPPVIFLHGCE